MDTTNATTDTPPANIPRWRRFGYFGCFLLALLMGLELAARILVATGNNGTLRRVVADYDRLVAQGPEWIRFVPDNELSYRLRPNFQTHSAQGGGITRHNRDGFRNNADFTPKSATVLRIACFGASTTYGVGVEDNRDTYPAQLEELLNSTFKPAGWERVEVLNLGVGGYTTREILGTMKRMLPKLKPDVVLIQNSINDVIPRFYPEYDPEYRHFRTPFAPLDLSWVDRFAYRSRAWVVLAYGMGWIKPLSLQSQTQYPMPPVEEALANLEKYPPTGFEANLKEEVKLAQDAGCRLWLLTQAYLDTPAFAGPDEASRRLESGYRDGLAEHTALVEDVAKASGTGLILLDESMPREQRYFADPIHMNAAGNRVKAKLIAEALAGSLPAPPR